MFNPITWPFAKDCWVDYDTCISYSEFVLCSRNGWATIRTSNQPYNCRKYWNFEQITPSSSGYCAQGTAISQQWSSTTLVYWSSNPLNYWQYLGRYQILLEASYGISARFSQFGNNTSKSNHGIQIPHRLQGYELVDSSGKATGCGKRAARSFSELKSSYCKIPLPVS